MRSKCLSALLAVILVLGTTAVACAPAPEVIKETVVVEKEVVVTATPAPPKEEVVTLHYTDWLCAEDAFKAGVKNIVDEFERRNPNIKIDVEPIPWASYFPELGLRIAAGTAPDVATIGVHALSIYAAMGALEDVSDVLTPEIEEQLYPGHVQACTWKGTLVGVPFLSVPLIMWINTDLAEGAGLDPDKPPATWEEFRTWAERMNDPSQGIYGYGHVASGGDHETNFRPFLLQAGTRYLDEDFNIVINNEAGVRALEFVVGMMQDGYVPRGVDVRELRDMFAKGKLGFYYDGPWLPGIIASLNPDFTAYTSAPLPAGPAGRGTNLQGGDVVVFKQSKHPEEAKKFLAFWLSDFAQEEVFTMLRGPAIKSILESHAEEDPSLKPVLDSTAFITDMGWLPEYAEMTKVIRTALEAAYLGQMTPKEALDEAAGKLDIILGDKYRE